MNACPVFPATLFGLVGGVVHRMVAFLLLCVRASGLGASRAITLQTHAWIVALAARPLAFPRNVARPAERAPFGTQPRHARPSCTRARWESDGRGGSPGASKAMPSSRETFGWLVAFVRAALCDSGIAFGELSRATPPPSPSRKGRGEDLGCNTGFRRDPGCSPKRSEFAWPGLDARAAGTPRTCRDTGRPRATEAAKALSTGGEGRASRASCEFSTGFRNWAWALHSQ